MEDAHALAETISSAEAVPGSGWVAAVSASLAAGLVAKTAARSEGWSGAEGARAQAIDLRDRLLALAERDARAYERALTALERRGSNLAKALASAADAGPTVASPAPRLGSFGRLSSRTSIGGTSSNVMIG